MAKTDTPWQNYNKVSNSSALIQKARRIFLSGRKITALKLNQELNTNDARKIISDLRKEGMKISDIFLDNGRKLYWLEPDTRQQSLNFKEDGDE